MQPLVYRLGYVALNVVDLDACVADAVAVAGVSVVEKTADRALMTSNARHAELVLHKASSNEARAIGLEALDANAVAAVAANVRQAGLRLISEQPSLPAIQRSVTFATSEGHVFEVHTPMARDQKPRYPGPGIHPRCIDHVNLAAVDPEKMTKQLEQVLGLRLSERTSGYELVWLRGADGRHHTVGFVKGRSGIHHYSWEFSDFADFKRLGDVLDTFDRQLVWGPGRHGAGDNLFTYYVDPAGFMVECTAEMEVISEMNFAPRIVDPGENLSNWKVVNRWGTLPSAAWLNHHCDFAVPFANGQQ
ncbi:VOC family protein [Ensifer adhaerens]|uniref:VOC family protein n=1 Tax=Ensifer adhaerens TaxID=106592 RepID=UPI000FDBD57E|nr:VOC family protein [Ensifer adhaerens]MDF8357673.1 VOC family protein [Ensifer adhaerens]THA60185.1 glyoxalase [Ensifer adhaerens]